VALEDGALYRIYCKAPPLSNDRGSEGDAELRASWYVDGVYD
jgi:hypothetical protein